ncbi:MAG: hypothetical protein ABW086_00555 [Sedimenticola sp.]
MQIPSPAGEMHDLHEALVVHVAGAVKHTITAPGTLFGRMPG